MATALAAVLAAAVTASGPEMVSGEVAEPQRLDLRGEWEATFHLDGSIFHGEAWANKFGGLTVAWERANRNYLYAYPQVFDEGNGRLRTGDRLGTYEQTGNHLRICLGGIGSRPASFQAGKGQHLLILRRVKPRD